MCEALLLRGGGQLLWETPRPPVSAARNVPIMLAWVGSYGFSPPKTGNMNGKYIVSSGGKTV